MTSVEVDITPARQVLAGVQRNISAGGLWGFAKQVAEPRFASQAAQRFDAGGDSASGRWAPLAEATVEIRTNLGFLPIRINERTGMLRNWLTNPNSILAADALGMTMTYPGQPSALLMRRLRQAAGRGRGPARPVIAYGASDVAYILRSLESWAMVGSAR